MVTYVSEWRRSKWRVLSGADQRWYQRQRGRLQKLWKRISQSPNIAVISIEYGERPLIFLFERLRSAPGFLRC